MGVTVKGREPRKGEEGNHQMWAIFRLCQDLLCWIFFLWPHNPPEVCPSVYCFPQGLTCRVSKTMKVKPGCLGTAIPHYDVQVCVVHSGGREKGENTNFSVTYLLHFSFRKNNEKKDIKTIWKGRKEGKARRRKKRKGTFLYSYCAEKNTLNSQQISWLVSLINIYIFKTKIGVNFSISFCYLLLLLNNLGWPSSWVN